MFGVYCFQPGYALLAVGSDQIDIGLTVREIVI